MAQADRTLPRLSTLFTDPRLAAIFMQAERDCPPAPVEASRPKPVLVGGAAVRVLEFA